jgi:hypothetical protein
LCHENLTTSQSSSYSYANNSPTNLIDPKGTDGCRRLPNGNCVPEPKMPIGDGEPIRKRPRMLTDPPPSPSPTPSVTPTPGPPPPQNCPDDTGYHPFLPRGIIGLTGGASGFFGIFNGASANVNGVVGFANNGDNIKLGTAGSVGGWADTPRTDRWALGASAGAGGGIFVSNAQSFDQLNGGFDSYQVAVGPLNFEYAYSGDVWTFSGVVARGTGGGITHYQTYTPDWSTHEIVIH